MSPLMLPDPEGALPDPDLISPYPKLVSLDPERSWPNELSQGLERL